MTNLSTLNFGRAAIVLLNATDKQKAAHFRPPGFGGPGRLILPPFDSLEPPAAVAGTKAQTVLDNGSYYH